MGSKKIYAVKNGRTAGLFYDWDSCKAQVDGYAGAQYKSFTTEEAAKAYLAGAQEDNAAPEGTPAAAAIMAQPAETITLTDGAAYNLADKCDRARLLAKMASAIADTNGGDGAMGMLIEEAVETVEAMQEGLPFV